MATSFSISKSHSPPHSSHFPFLFLGFDHDELLNSSLDFSFDKHRQELTALMQTLSSPLSNRILASSFSKLFQDIVSNFHSDLSTIPTLWEENEYFLRELLRSKVPIVYCISNRAENYPSRPRHVSSYDSFHQLLIHLERDWGEGGKNVRQRTYTEGIIPLLQKYLPIYSNTKVLVPGAGLGRLAVELMVLGYRVEANECSSLMIRVLNSLLNEILPSDQRLYFYPYLHFHPADEWDHKRRLKSSIFPSTDSSHISRWIQNQRNISANSDRNHSHLNPPRLLIQSGDFLSVYSSSSPSSSSSSSMNANKEKERGDNQNQDQGQDQDQDQESGGYPKNSFDGIVTSFFLDTGDDVLEYLLTLHHLLRPGGIWINSGPLHYHSATETPYSYHVLREIIKGLGFISLESKIVESSYCGEEEVVMKPEYYRYPIEVWQLEKKTTVHENASFTQESNQRNEVNTSGRFVLNLFGRKK